MGEVMQSRAIIETLIVGIAAEASTEEDWKALEDAYKDLRAAAGRGDTAEANLAHAAFHNGLLQATRGRCRRWPKPRGCHRSVGRLPAMASATVRGCAAMDVRHRGAGRDGYQQRRHVPIRAGD
jgi:hypothetical protein